MRQAHILSRMVIPLLMISAYAVPGEATAQGAAPTYVYVDLGTLPGGSYPGSTAFGINNHNHAVGMSSTPGRRVHGFLWQNGTMQDLSSLPGADFSIASAINDEDQIVGISDTANGQSHAVLWQGGVVHDLGTLPGGAFSAANAISGRGDIVGSATPRGGVQAHGVLWHGGSVVDLGTLPGGVGSDARAVNRSAQVVGESLMADGHFHGYFWQDGTMTDLGSLGGDTTFVYGISDLGMVVGTSTTASGSTHVFLWQSGRMTDLGTPFGSTFVGSMAINNRGQIVASAGHIALWQSGVWFDLGSLPTGFGSSWAYAINDLGSIAGASLVPDDKYHAILLRSRAEDFPSIGFNGRSSYVEAPAASDLNIQGDWTVEAWFKDEDPNGFDHDYRQIVMKGDRLSSPEAPYFVLIGNRQIIAGTRTMGQDYAISYDPSWLKLDPAAWHQVVVTFQASSNWLELWLDGQRLYRTAVPGHSTVGNSLPLEIGRNGPATGKYWLGRIDDVRIWNIVRSDAEIATDYAMEPKGPQPGLLANWRFDEASGSFAADSSGHEHTATLQGGGSFASNP